MPEPCEDFNLEAGHELRITEIDDHIKVIVEKGGLAEVFGRELPCEEPVFFHKGQKLAIFCWKPTKIKISGVLR